MTAALRNNKDFLAGLLFFALVLLSAVMVSCHIPNIRPISAM